MTNKKMNLAINFLIVFSISTFILLTHSCNKDVLSKNFMENNESIENLSRDSLVTIYVNWNNEKIANKIEFDVDFVIKSEFSASEREILLIQRVKNLVSNDISEKIKAYLDEYSAKYQTSYLDDGNYQRKEKFASEYLPLFKSVERTTCYHEWLNCTSLPNNGCDEEGNFIFYEQLQPNEGDLPKHPYEVECKRQENTSDCDNSYHWYAGNYNGNCRFYWWCSDIVYRALMPSGISGYTVNTPIASTFLGNQHEIAVNTAWALSSCTQDEWMSSTVFFKRCSYSIDDNIHK